MRAVVRVGTVIAVGLDEKGLNTLAEAANALSPGVRVMTCSSLDEALQSAGPPGGELLALVDPSEGDLARAASAVSDDQLPRWPVFVMGEGLPADGAWFVPPAQWSAPVLEKVLRVAMKQHALTREALRSRGDLWTIARRMSHEMRSPLGCILTTTELMREEVEAESPASATIQAVADSGHELLEIVDRFTFLVRASARPLAVAAVDMGTIVWTAMQRLEPLIRNAGAVIVEPAEWPRVTGVAEWLERIWLELLMNALRHAGAHPRVELTSASEGDSWRFSIRDHGAGIPAAEAATLLLPFHRLHEKTSGRGLGLALVQRLVDLQGGQFGYEPVAGGGAGFYFVIPRR